MILLKRILLIILVCTIGLSFTCCNDKHPTAEESKFESSVSLVCEKMDVSREEAISILESLSDCGLDERIDEIYTATDAEGNTFYKVWFGLNLLSVYLNGSSVSKIYKHGEQIFPKSEEIEKDENTNDTSADNNTSNNDNKEEEKEPETVDLDLTLVSLTFLRIKRLGLEENRLLGTGSLSVRDKDERETPSRSFTNTIKDAQNQNLNFDLNRVCLHINMI